MIIRSTISGVGNECNLYMSVWQISSDHDLIFMVNWSLFCVCVFNLFFKSFKQYTIDQLIKRLIKVYVHCCPVGLN